MANKLISIHKLADALAQQAAAGWTATSGDGYYDMDGGGPWTKEHPWNPRAVVEHMEPRAFARFERTMGDVNAVVVLEIRKVGKYDRNIHQGRCVEGHTFVNGGCFTRRGVDCESVAMVDDAKERYGHDYGDVASMLAGEWERCSKAVNARKTAVAVPGTPFTRQPEWFAQAAETLRNRGSVSLAPHGFGTGYTLSHGSAPRRFAKRAPARLEEMLGGISPVFIETYDAD